MGLESLNVAFLTANLVGLWPLRVYYDEKSRQFRTLGVKLRSFSTLWFTLLFVLEIVNLPLIAKYQYYSWFAGRSQVKTGDVYEISMLLAFCDVWVATAIPYTSILYLKEYKEVLRLLNYFDNSSSLTGSSKRDLSIKLRTFSALLVTTVMVSYQPLKAQQKIDEIICFLGSFTVRSKCRNHRVLL